MKQTAVEWFEQKLDDLEIEIPFGIFEQALEMEKEQSIKFGKIVADKWSMIPVPLENIEDTYNKTFKSE